MSLIVVSEKTRIFIPIYDPSCRDEGEILGLGLIPQQVRDCPPQARIDISEESNSYVVSSELPGVARKNLWVSIKERTLAIYAGITGERQENGDYRYTEELLGGIRGEITLPEQAFRDPEVAEFDNGSLHLVFPKKTEEFLEQLAFA